MKAYRITGEFQMGANRQGFTLETLADTEDDAAEWAYSVLGSRHRAKRRQITIDDVEEQELADVEDAIVRYALEEEQ